MSPTRQNVAHSIFQRLLNLAKTNKEDFNLLLSRYGMERFLYRLSISPHNERFILKGASLFLVWKGQNYRVTRDADLLGFGSSDIEQLADVFRDICRVEFQGDGMIYLPESLNAEESREDQEYDGVRITLVGFLNQARIPLQLDIGFGDVVTPVPEHIEYPTFLKTNGYRIRDGGFERKNMNHIKTGAESSGCVMDLPKTIAKGDDVCQIRFRR